MLAVALGLAELVAVNVCVPVTEGEAVGEAEYVGVKVPVTLAVLVELGV